MKTNTKFQKEVQLNAEEPVLCTISESSIKIEDLQLEFNCGFNMFEKRLQITLYGDKAIELPVITLSQMYKLFIDVQAILPKEKGWYVTHFIIKPCQKINYPIHVGLNVLSGITSMAFSISFFCSDFLF